MSEGFIHGLILLIGYASGAVTVLIVWTLAERMFRKKEES